MGMHIIQYYIWISCHDVIIFSDPIWMLLSFWDRPGRLQVATEACDQLDVQTAGRRVGGPAELGRSHWIGWMCMGFVPEL